MKFKFDVGNFNKIFDELLHHGKIRLSHSIPQLEEFKRRAYCK